MVWLVAAIAAAVVTWAALGITHVPPRHVALIDGRRTATGRSWRPPLLSSVTLIDMTPRDLEFEGSAARGVLTIEPDPSNLPPVPVESFRGRAAWLLEQAASVPDIAAEWGRHVEKLVESTGWSVISVEAGRPPGPGLGAVVGIVEQVKAAIESGQAERALEDVTDRIVSWVERSRDVS